MPSVHIIRAAACAAVALSIAAPLRAQPRASERGGVWQTIDGTTLRVEYGRPSARGRTLFGGLIHWNEVWTPGANWATTLEVDHDVRINDVPVPAGEYSMWLIPHASGDWTVGLDERVRRFHTQRPDSTGFAVRIPATPATGEHVERLSFRIEDLRRNAATLHFLWGETVLPLEVRFRTSLASPDLTDAQMAPYLGDYSVTIYGEAQPDVFPLAIVDADGHLRGGDGERAFVEFIPTDEPHVFLIGMLRDGEIFDVEETQATFSVEDGRATGFVVPGTGIPIWMEATRSR